MVKEKIDKSKYDISSVVRVFKILNYIATSNINKGATLSNIAEHIGASVSTAHRYLQTIERLGHVVKNDRNNYQLGPGILGLAGKYLEQINLPQLALPFMKELADEVEETVHLAVPSGTEVTYIAKAVGPKSVSMTAQIGSRMPMYSTSLGKIMLAYLPQERLEAVINEGLEARTENTITSPEELGIELKKILEHGYSIDDVENEGGVRCIGAPIFNYQKELLGAISVSGPVDRVDKSFIKEIHPLVTKTALAISRRMGFPE